jgi:hypothetical protein
LFFPGLCPDAQSGRQTPPDVKAARRNTERLGLLVPGHETQLALVDLLEPHLRRGTQATAAEASGRGDRWRGDARDQREGQDET